MLNDTVYYIAISEHDKFDSEYVRNDLFCYDITKKTKSLIYENVDYQNTPSFYYPVTYNNGNIYFIACYSKFMEYNIETGSIKTILSTEENYIHINNVIIHDNKIIYEGKNDRDEKVAWDLYIIDLTK